MVVYFYLGFDWSKVKQLKAPYLPDIILDVNTNTTPVKNNFPLQNELMIESNTSVCNSKLLSNSNEATGKSEIAFMRKDILVQENSKESTKKRELVMQVRNRKFSILGLP